MFDGGTQRKREVSLRGASAKQSREEVLAKARAEREARYNTRAQERAATLIQVIWRRGRVLACERAAERRAFDEEAAAGAMAAGERLLLLVRRLLFFARAGDDDARLARTLQALVSAEVGAAYLSRAATPEGRLALLHQLSGLSALALAVLRRTVSSGAAPPQLPMQFLLSFSQAAAWPPKLAADDVSRLLQPALARLVDEGLYPALRLVLTGPGGAGAALQAATLALLPLRAMPLDGPADGPASPPRRPPRGALGPLRPAERAHALLAGHLWSLPDLLQRLPEVAAAMFRRPALWRACVPALAAAIRAAPGLEWVADGAWGAAALLATLVDGAEASLPGSPPEAMAAYVSVLGSLLRAAPPAALPAPPQENVDSDSDMPDAPPMPLDGPNAALASRIARAAAPAHLRALLSPPLLPAAPAGRPIGLPPPLASVASAAGGLKSPPSDAADPSEVGSAAPAVSGFVAELLRRCPSLAPAALNAVAFQTDAVRGLWAWLVSPAGGAGQLHALATGSCYLPSSPPGATAPAAAVIGLFCRLLVHAVDGSDDAELLGGGRPFAGRELADLVPLLKQVALRALMPGGAGGSGPAGSSPPDPTLRRLTLAALCRLHSRAAKAGCVPGDAWLAPELQTEQFLADAAAPEGLGGASAASEERGRRARDILRQVPFMVPFESRVRIFQTLVAADKDGIRGPGWGGMRPHALVSIRRDFLFEDAFAGLNHLRGELRQAVRVQFVSELGLEEAGVDGGGLFKEFMTSLAKTAFDSQYALFKATPDRLLYPNPSSHLVSGEHLRQFEFLGRMLGKAMYEGVLLDLPFARFFLSKILGKHNYVNDLPSLDPDLYKNLMFLKRLETGVEDLGLNFAVVDNEFGEAREVPLMPGGEREAVTAENRVRYIHLVANYRLNVQIARQCAAFQRGLHDLVRPEWLAMFSEEELQVLVAGSRAAPDVEDLRRHTAYSGGYTEEHPTVRAFWEVVSSFSAEQRRALLKFVTSSHRGPLLGFRYLVPSFCIHRGDPDTDRLPSASTCMNLLKLPPYPDASTLREKLTYAISSNAGFELS